MGWNDGAVQITWTNPSQGPAIDYVELNWWDGTNQVRSDQDITGTTSVNLDTLGTTTPPQQAWLWMSGSADDGDVSFTSEWSLDQP